jgi:uncharacterized protein
MNVTEALAARCRRGRYRGDVEPGEVVAVRFGKWAGRPHWEMDLRYLGADRFGHWLGSPAGMPMRRPGRQAWADAELAMLVPTEGEYVASFNGRAVDDAIYVDITDRPVLEGGAAGAVLRAVDLDLDVVLRHDGRIYVDDEDEFEEHRVEYGYPEDAVTAALASCRAVLAAITAEEEPWRSVGHRWTARAAEQPLAPFPAWVAG